MKLKLIVYLSVVMFFTCIRPLKYNKEIPQNLREHLIKYDKNNNIVIDDFEDRDYIDECVGIWYKQDDTPNQGNSVCEMRLVQGVSNRGNAIRLDYTLGPKFQYRYVILDDNFKFPLNLSEYKSLSFWLRGSGHKLRVKLWSENVEGWDWHGFTISATPREWKKFVIPFTMFKQEGWGKPQKLDLRLIKKIDFQTASMQVNEKGWFEVDNIKVTKTISKEFQFKEFPVVRQDKLKNGCFLGVFGPNYINYLSLVHSLEKKIGKKFSHIMWYEDWRTEFPLATIKKLWDAGYSSHITWEAWNMETHEGIKLDEILSGKWDSYIKEWAQGAKKFGKPLFIRWGHEFNGNWYPWSVPQNEFDSKKYVKTFQYLHKMFDKYGATNVLWVWCPMNQSFPRNEKNNIIDAYPGDEYVDWIGIDGYNFGVTPPWSDKWFSFNEIFGNVYTTIIENFPDKPIMIGEFATGPNGGDKSEWIKDAFVQIRNVFKAIKLVIWFNIDKETDWRIDENPRTALAFKESVESDYFLTSRDNLFNLKKYIKKERNLYLSLLNKINPYWEKKILDVPYKPVNLKIDGNLQEWEKYFKIILTQKKEYLVSGVQYSGKDDFFAQIGLLWDEKNLYIGAKITDDVPINNQFRDGDIWQGDCLEITISLNPEADLKRTSFEKNDFQILISPGNQKNIPPHIWNVTKHQKIDGVVKVNKWEKGYIVEIKVPFKELGDFVPAEGMQIGFNIAVDDADETNKRESQAIWFGNSSFYYNPSVWNLIKFIRK